MHTDKLDWLVRWVHLGNTCFNMTKGGIGPGKMKNIEGKAQHWNRLWEIVDNPQSISSQDVVIVSLWDYDSRNFTINIDHYKIHDKVMRVGYITSPRPHPPRDASGVRGSCVCEGMCPSVVSAEGLVSALVCSVCFPGTCDSFLRAACLGGAVHRDEPLCSALSTSALWLAC